MIDGHGNGYYSGYQNGGGCGVKSGADNNRRWHGNGENYDFGDGIGVGPVGGGVPSNGLFATGAGLIGAVLAARCRKC